MRWDSLVIYDTFFLACFTTVRLRYCWNWLSSRRSYWRIQENSPRHWGSQWFCGACSRYNAATVVISSMTDASWKDTGLKMSKQIKFSPEHLRYQGQMMQWSKQKNQVVWYRHRYCTAMYKIRELLLRNLLVFRQTDRHFFLRGQTAS